MNSYTFKHLIFILGMIFIFKFVDAQVVEKVAGVPADFTYNREFIPVVYDGELFVSLRNSPNPATLFRYDGTQFQQFSFPVNYSLVSDVKPFTFENELYIGANISGQYRYMKYNGSSIDTLSLPPNHVIRTRTDIVLYQDKIHLYTIEWIGSSGYIRILAFDGNDFQNVPIPQNHSFDSEHRLAVFNDKVFYSGYETVGSTGYSRFYQYNGDFFSIVNRPSSVSSIRDRNGVAILNNKYYAIWSVDSEIQLLGFDGLQYHKATLPLGYNVSFSNSTMKTYNGYLYLPLRNTSTSTNELFRFDGTNFEKINLPVGHSLAMPSSTRPMEWAIYDCKLYLGLRDTVNQYRLYSVTAPTDMDVEIEIDTTDGYKLSALVDGGSPPFNYLWNNDADTSVISNLSSGTYELIVTDAHGCETTASVSIGDVTSVQETLSDNLLSIYPNPAQEMLNMEFVDLNDTPILHIEIINLEGKVVFAKPSFDINENQTLQIDISNQPNGIYFVRLINDNKSFMQKFVIQR